MIDLTGLDVSESSSSHPSGSSSARNRPKGRILPEAMHGQNFAPRELNEAQIERVKRMTNEEALDREIKPGRVKSLMRLASSGSQQKILIGSNLPGLLAFLTEVMIVDLSSRAWHEASLKERKTLQAEDVGRAVGNCENKMFDFLIDIVPHPRDGGRCRSE